MSGLTYRWLRSLIVWGREEKKDPAVIGRPVSSRPGPDVIYAQRRTLPEPPEFSRWQKLFGARRFHRNLVAQNVNLRGIITDMEERLIETGRIALRADAAEQTLASIQILQNDAVLAHRYMTDEPRLRHDLKDALDKLETMRDEHDQSFSAYQLFLKNYPNYRLRIRPNTKILEAVNPVIERAKAKAAAKLKAKK